MIRLISGTDLASWLDMKTSIEIAEAFFNDYNPEEYTTKPRSVTQISELDAVWLDMQAYSLRHGAYLIKIINEYRQNPVKHGFETANGMILLFDVGTGRLKGLVDAVQLTALRTGAIGGVGAKYMAREDVEVVGLIGSGRTAWTQLTAITTVRDIRSARVYSPTRENREKLAKRASKDLGIECNPTDSPREAVLEADVVITATNSAEPVISGEWLSDDAHVTSIGALPTRRELDSKTFQRANIIAADLKESVLREAGDLIAAINSGVVDASKVLELHDIVKKGKNVRGDGSMLTLLKSVGFAAIDLFFVTEVLKKAEEEGIGRVIEI